MYKPPNGYKMKKQLIVSAALFVSFLSGTHTVEAASTYKKPRQMWAQSYLYHNSPKLDFRKWVSEKPEMKDKFIILEFWRTWCSACKKVTPVFNELQKKYGDDLVIISVTGETEEQLKSYKGPKKEYYQALDAFQTDSDTPELCEDAGGCGSYEDEEDAGGCGSYDDNDEYNEDVSSSEVQQQKPGQGVTESKYGVTGWPHVVLLEPEDRVVIWEGFPLQEGYELNAEKIEKYISAYKNSTP